jgi:hypothetical protein
LYFAVYFVFDRGGFDCVFCAKAFFVQAKIAGLNSRLLCCFFLFYQERTQYQYFL